MKKLMLVMAAALLLAACSKKNDVKPSSNTTLAEVVGKWSATVDSTTTIVNEKPNLVVTNYTLGQQVWQFNADGTGSLTEGSDAAVPITFTVSKGIMQVIVPEQGTAVEELINFNILVVSSTELGLGFSEEGESESIYFTKE